MNSGLRTRLGLLTAGLTLLAGSPAVHAELTPNSQLWPHLSRPSAFASLQRLAKAETDASDELRERIDLIGQVNTEKNRDTESESDDDRPAAYGGLWWTVQEWLARANRDFQGVIVKDLSTPVETEQASDEQNEEPDDAERAAGNNNRNDAQLAAERAAAEAEEKRLAAEAEEERRRLQAAKEARQQAIEKRAVQQARERQEAEKLRRAAEAAAKLERKKRQAAEAARRQAEQQAAAAIEQARRLQQETQQRQADNRRQVETEVSQAATVSTPQPNINRRRIDLRAEPLEESRTSVNAQAAGDDENSNVAELTENTRSSYRPSSYRARVAAWRRNSYRRRVRRSYSQRWCRRAGSRSRVPGRYTVARGDTLWHISRRHYRRGRYYRLIYRANRRRIRNPNLIYPCQRLYLPRFRRR